MPGEEATAVLLEQRPKLFAIGARHIEIRHFSVVKKTESSLWAGRRQFGQARQYLEQKYVPVCAAFVAVLTDEASEVKVVWAEDKPHLLLSLAAGAGVRRLTVVGVYLTARRTPFAKVGFLRALEQ